MSARLAMRVLESAIPKPLKPTAVVMALFGNDAGERIYPGVDRVAFLLGDSRRNVERNISRLRAMGVLEAQTPLQGGRLPGGRGRSVLYRLNVAALPSRAKYEPRHRRQGSETENTDTSVGVSALETPTPAPQTPTPMASTPTNPAENPDTHVGGSFRSDLLETTRERERHRNTSR
jgi:hypothetical protein